MCSGSGWCVLPRQSFQTPRGLFDVELCDDGRVYLHGSKVTHTLETGQIEAMVELQTADRFR